jgi:hypothetical protein
MNSHPIIKKEKIWDKSKHPLTLQQPKIIFSNPPTLQKEKSK